MVCLEVAVLLGGTDLTFGENSLSHHCSEGVTYPSTLCHKPKNARHNRFYRPGGLIRCKGPAPCTPGVFALWSGLLS